MIIPINIDKRIGANTNDSVTCANLLRKTKWNFKKHEWKEIF